MTTRILPWQEWHRIAPQFEAQGVPLPASDATILVAEEADRIVGFLVMQACTHLEPLWIDEAYRGKVYWPALVHHAEALLSKGSYFVFAPTSHVAAMAEAVKLQKLPWTIYKGDV